jgi:thiamine-monophosphate kinase
MTSVRDLGEKGLLNRLASFCQPDTLGDDAALLTVSPGYQLVVSSDVLVDGVHFSVGWANRTQRTTTPRDAGWRAAAANLSDLAAMGAQPLGITVGLSLPGELPVAWVEDMYQGMADCCHQYGTGIVGGDICRSTVLSMAIAIFGEVQPGAVIHRHAARPGQVILITGVHGLSRAGLDLLLLPEQATPLTEQDRQLLMVAHQRPVPRLDVVHQLQTLGILTADAPAIAGMDSSDGLADAVMQICQASQVGAQLFLEHIPISPLLAKWRSPQQALEWTLYGGEDFELVLCMQPEQAQKLQHQVLGCSVIGEIIEPLEVTVVDRHQKTIAELTMQQTFQHF